MPWIILRPIHIITEVEIIIRELKYVNGTVKNISRKRIASWAAEEKTETFFNQPREKRWNHRKRSSCCESEKKKQLQMQDFGHFGVCL